MGLRLTHGVLHGYFVFLGYAVARVMGHLLAYPTGRFFPQCTPQVAE